ncbi:putative proline-rich receptor-like protein kinase PERK3 [Iris pallida]|uniref:Proline-rich receptor-like protein kinase PERK3 n=1 Tax=Iris pallida TaxID=29817 RepID=A0AAX6GB78_IRIPA|nr:putative proline-rich receptor-like protein kinase PERK3 [Iris pallida]
MRPPVSAPDAAPSRSPAELPSANPRSPAPVPVGAPQQPARPPPSQNPPAPRRQPPIAVNPAPVPLVRPTSPRPGSPCRRCPSSHVPVRLLFGRDPWPCPSFCIFPTFFDDVAVPALFRDTFAVRSSFSFYYSSESSSRAIRGITPCPAHFCLVDDEKWFPIPFGNSVLATS